MAYVEQVEQVTATIVEGVAAELELDVQPFMLSSAVIGNGDKQSGLNAKEENFMAAFNKEPGRHDR